MTAQQRKLFFIGVIVAMLVLPLAGGWLKWGGLPPGFGIFPAQQVQEEPGFNIIYFLAIAAFGVLLFAFIFFPQFFGFKIAWGKNPTLGRYPIWFWIGFAVNLISWAVMWGQFSFVGSLVHYTFVPLWWGFILALDGLVYYRTNGRSILATRPMLLFWLAVTSVILWFLFEYYNYFAVENWYYPITDVWSPLGYRIWYSLCYTTVWPAIFEFYTLLKTFPGLSKRYSNGPKFTISKTIWWGVFAGGLVLTFLFGLFPHLFFFALWVGPMILIIGTLGAAGYWTPLDPIARGDWSYTVLFSLSGLGNAFFWEGWNYWSPPTNPSFWKYDIPYVNVLHIFEMPALGFIGYLPFGLGCLILWLFVADLLGWDPVFEETKESIGG